MDQGEQGRVSTPALSRNSCFLPLVIPATSPFSSRPSHHRDTHPMKCTTGETAEPRDVTLALHWESLSWGLILWWHHFPCHSAPTLPSPPPGLAKLVLYKWLPESQQQQPSRSPAWGYPATSPYHPKFCQTVFWALTKMGQVQRHAGLGSVTGE